MIVIFKTLALSKLGNTPKLNLPRVGLIASTRPNYEIKIDVTEEKNKSGLKRKTMVIYSRQWYMIVGW